MDERRKRGEEGRREIKDEERRGGTTLRPDWISSNDNLAREKKWMSVLPRYYVIMSRAFPGAVVANIS